MCSSLSEGETGMHFDHNCINMQAAHNVSLFVLSYLY
jgi:hypothetical protein